MNHIYLLKLDNGARIEVQAGEEFALKPGNDCVFRRDYYLDLGTVAAELPPDTPSMSERPVVQRIAEKEDYALLPANDRRAREAVRTAQIFVDQLKLEMNLLNAHYSLDGKLVTIQFSADGRVDFRELVKELARALSTRIELRQIGVRDESGICGGIGVCGQELCCARFLKEFSSINVRMAKEQDLALTPASISGTCGRLKCCLKFEHEGYLELEKGMPRRGEWLSTPDGRGRVTDRNLLTQKVTVQLESGNLAQFARADVEPAHAPTPQEMAEKNRSSDNRNPRRGGNDKNRGNDNNRNPRRGNDNKNKSGERRNPPPQAPAPAPETTPKHEDA